MHIERRDKRDSFYHCLQEDSLAFLQRLCGEVWTDYNPHDPGVTILDALNYALFDLHYKCGFPLVDYLVDPHLDSVPFDRMGLLPDECLFRGSVVTPEDYERLIESHISGVAACRAVFFRGKYEFRLRISDGAARESVATAVERLYYGHRNLCEDLGAIRFEDIPFEEPAAAEDSAPAHNSDPEGTGAVYRNFSGYRSVQDDLPDCYGINRNGPPAIRTPEKAGRTRQLQAYLLIFDHLLAFASERLADIPEMLRLSGELPSVRWSEVEAGDNEALVDPEKRGIPAGAVSFVAARRTAWFDTLDMMYGEDTSEYFMEDSPAGIFRKRAALIRRFPPLNADRFRSFDRTDSRSVPVLRQWASVILGDGDRREHPLGNLFSRYRLTLVPDPLFFRDYKIMLDIEFTIDERDGYRHNGFGPIPATKVDCGEEDFHALKKELEFFWHNILFEGLLSHGGELDNYRCARSGGSDGYVMLWRHPQGGRWLNLGYFPTREKLVRTAGVLRAFLEHLRLESERFYLIEHPLLYPDGVPKSREFCLTLFFPAWIRSESEREAVAVRLRERLPAHLDADFRWLHADQWFSLEKFYVEWRQAMEDGDAGKERGMAEMLRLFIDE